MPCYHPIPAFRSNNINPSGKRSLVFKSKAWRFSSEYSRRLAANEIFEMPCGQCIGCRLNHSRMWAIRCMHEASLHERNCFVTLTYRPEKVPPGGTLVLSDVQRFMKRLRFKYGPGVRVAYCGEYGEKFGRPHYHLLLFNHDFQDKSLMFLSKRGDKVFRSESLDELWTDPSDGVNYGISSIGDITFDSAAYVARYVTKKLRGRCAGKDHREVDPISGRVIDSRLPEFFKTSRNPGVGRSWYDLYRTDIFPDDFCLVSRPGKGKVRSSVPVYYRRLMEKFFPEYYEEIRKKRVERALLRGSDNTLDRLAVREFCELDKIKPLRRSYEDGA